MHEANGAQHPIKYFIFVSSLLYSLKLCWHSIKTTTVIKLTMVNTKLIYIYKLQCEENFFVISKNEIVLFQSGCGQQWFFLKVCSHCSVSILMWDSLYVMFNREQAILKSGSSLNAVMPFKLIKTHFRPFIKGGWL